MPINDALTNLYGEPAQESLPGQTPSDRSNRPELPDPSRLPHSSVLVALFILPPPSAAELARPLAGRPRRPVEELLSQLQVNERRLVMDHLGNSTGWNPDHWQETAGEVNEYRANTMFLPETYYPDSAVQIRRLLALDLVDNYRTALAAGLEERIDLRERLLAAFRKTARKELSEWEERLHNAGAHYELTPLADLPAEQTPGSYYEKMTRQHAARARAAMKRARQERK